MRVVVLVKEVPDTYGQRKLALETGLTDRADGDQVLDEIGERAVEAALQLADAHGDAEVEVLSMAPETATGTIRKGLAMGAAKAVHVTDPALLGADLALTARVLAAAVKRGEYDVVVTGNLSTDGKTGMLPAMLAELLDLPQLTELSDMHVDGTRLTGTRHTDEGVMTLGADLPALVSITEAFPDARFPNFKGIMAAKKKPVEVLSLADLGIEAEDHSVPHSIMISADERPPREAGEKITDDGDGGTRLAEFLVSNKLV